VPQGPEPRFSSEGLGRYGRYRVERLIGSGSAGAVFLGRDPILGRPVAIKVVPLRTCRSSAEKAERMELLRRAFGPLGSLAHPNLVTVHDVGIEEEHSFLVMEYVPGRDLSSHLADGSLAPDRVIGLATQLAQALDFAHGSNLTHGDLKPSNVIVTPGWEVRLTDLGVVSALSSSGLGHASSRWDRPEHLAPEVAEGEEPSPASDRFALGVLLYSLLTGRLPFQGDDATTTLWRIANEQPPLPSDLAPELPVAVDGVLLRALAKKPVDRFAACSDLAEALRKALSEQRSGPHVYATQPLDEELRRQLHAAGAATTPLSAVTPEPAAAAITAPVRGEAGGAVGGRRRRLWPWAALGLLALALAAAGLLRNGPSEIPGTGQTGHSEPAAAPEGFSWDSSLPADEPTAPAAPETTAGPAPPVRTAVAGEEAAAPGIPPERKRSQETGNDAEGAVGDQANDSPDDARRAEERVEVRDVRLRVRLASEVPTGEITIWSGEEVLLERRFHFGGPFQRLRRNMAPGGQWEEILSIAPGLSYLRVRVTLPAGTLEEIPIRRTLRPGSEHVLEITISPSREIAARLRP
jgi:hypothetical protein